MTETPTPTTVLAPSQTGGARQRAYLTRWEIDDHHGAELVVKRCGDGAYRACFRAVTFERTAAGRVAISRHTPAAAVGWTIETTARYCAKRLGEINAETTAALAQRLAAASPDHGDHLARATRAGALGAMYAAAEHLHATCPEADPGRCATEAVAGWTCLAVTYPSGNPRAHAYYREDDERFEVSAFPDAHLATPHHEDLDVVAADLGASMVAHYRRTTA